MSAIEVQKGIFSRGFSGRQPTIPIDFRKLESSAKAQMSEKAWAYIAGGAGKEITQRNNVEAFSQFEIAPRMLKDVSSFSTATSLFGLTLNSPLMFAPIGVLDLVRPSADIILAEAAESLTVPMVFSNQASSSMESCSDRIKSVPTFFQLYWSKSDDLVKSLVHRAEKCGCKGIFITLDTTMLGWRPRDLDLAYLPFLHGDGLAQYIGDPVFESLVDDFTEGPLALKPEITLRAIYNLLRLNWRHPGGFFENLRTGRPLRSVKTFVNMYTRNDLNWDHIAKIKSWTSLPIILKGILHPEDARQAVERNFDGIVVSNHGGRQVDGSVSTLKSLQMIRGAIGPDYPVLFDSGIRSGSDLFKAIALGANAVLLGRPYVYGLAIDGLNGINQVCAHILAEFELTMRLSGCRCIQDIQQNMLVPSG